jgi:hypothetical protein
MFIIVIDVMNCFQNIFTVINTTITRLSHYSVKKIPRSFSSTKHNFMNTCPLSTFLSPDRAPLNADCFDVFSASKDDFLIRILFFSPTIWFKPVPKIAAKRQSIPSSKWEYVQYIKSVPYDTAIWEMNYHRQHIL